MDLLYRVKVGTTCDCTVKAPCTESHSVISDASSWASWLTAFLQKDKGKERDVIFFLNRNGITIDTAKKTVSTVEQ